MLSLMKFSCTKIYLLNTHTHTHTHAYIYIYIYIYKHCMRWIIGKKQRVRSPTYLPLRHDVFHLTERKRWKLNELIFTWRQHPTRHQLYGNLPPITKTIQVRRVRHAGHCWRSKDELISNVLLWTPAYGQAKAGQPARTYMQQLCEDTGCSPEDLPKSDGW